MGTVAYWPLQIQSPPEVRVQVRILDPADGWREKRSFTKPTSVRSRDVVSTLLSQELYIVAGGVVTRR